MIDFLAKLLGYVMRGCSWLTGNSYVPALLLFALAMQLLLCPFGIKQQKNMVKQASLRPKEMAIRNKYKGRTDQVTMKKLQNEIMELYQREGYSQFAGCLPMLLQLIIIFPLYQVVIRPLEFVGGLSETVCNELTAYVQSLGVTVSGNAAQVQLASWLAKGNAVVATEGVISQASVDAINGMTNIPIVSLFGVDLGVTPWEAMRMPGIWWLAIIPVLNLGLMYVSQFLSKKLSYQNPQAEQMNNSSMKIMMYVLPLMTMFITFGFAAAIGIYWIFRTLLSMLQQFIFAKAMPYPTFTEEDYKKAEREMKGTRKNKKSSAEYVVQPGEYRSLHHDD
ncbi:MAG: membrane protein insertase YidC [Clostridia bacterium]|nr:membrane protein insertase YidC [Clostridia bacterium]MBR2296529.1 membrane protein insertase YidC [Clostridia bacterium]